ncbi:aspartic proteinase from Irpex Lacteus [Basidiobolus meristosporus CBS 931.73]|uniref:Aspartic proteinase from Irpex Lacteus n=1 Tax=Basidiobolus meristosporus CBS 931.73 TaxID=1314790 RepID=A0A1Y1XZN0_9FUNG|nr:aspartic proteinase from Irpex Lacteus [Basidiobolus meristosporus CBS 931.73]ORX91207.1 aspartic proteinase from Irpex Lacteus [Basidiobolus meristosporus CBS 931.73]|eukprot:ORX64579.1 aspartic proteinase from Irpex Lacteus [Basidiobolus meristosporus CBS 931.73]
MARLITLFIAVAIVHPTFGAVLPRGNEVYTLPIRRSFAHASSISRRSVYARAVGSIPAQSNVVHYTASIGIGTPPTSYDLLIDTNSANTWVGAQKAYVHTSTSTQTADSVSVTYGSGSFSGTEFSDTVTISPGLVVQSQSIGVASSSQGFTDCDGILGLGPVDLTLGTLSPSTGSTVPTVVDNLFSQGTIPSNVFSLSFEPSTSLTSTNGEITFGGTDSTKYTGSIAYAPITATSPARDFWGVDGSFRYGASEPILSTTAGSVDSGTTLLLLPTDAFQKYLKATGAVIDKATGLPKLTSAQFAKLKSLFITIGGTTLELTANACIFPRALNTQIGGEAGGIYLAFGDLGSNSGAGLDFILGLTFLERFYSVYDADNKRVGFATTRFTHANTN